MAIKNNTKKPRGQYVRWPFETLAEGKSVIFKYGWSGLNKDALTTRIQQVVWGIQHRKKDQITLEIVNGGIKATMTKRVSPIGRLSVITKEAKKVLKTETGAADNKVIKVKQKPGPKPRNDKKAFGARPGTKGSTESVRRFFWRQAFLESMKTIPLSDLPACASIADAALKLYDSFVAEQNAEGKLEDERPGAGSLLSVLGEDGHVGPMGNSDEDTTLGGQPLDRH